MEGRSSMQRWTYKPGEYGEYIEHGESFEFKVASDPGMELGDEVVLKGESGDEIARGKVEGQQLDVGPESSRWESSVTVIRT
jgi:hypothetical protein